MDSVSQQSWNRTTPEALGESVGDLSTRKPRARNPALKSTPNRPGPTRAWRNRTARLGSTAHDLACARFAEISSNLIGRFKWAGGLFFKVKKFHSAGVKFKMASKLIITSNNELKFDSDEAMKRRLKQHHST